MMQMLIRLSFHNLKLITRIVQSSNASIQQLNTYIPGASIQLLGTCVSSEESIQSEYFKLDVDNMVELAHSQINATCSRKEKEKYRQAVLEDIRRRKFILYENAEHQKDKSEEDEDILYKMCLVQQEFMFLFANLNYGD